MGQGSITTLHPSLNEWGEEVVTGTKKVSCGEKAIWEDLWPLVEEHSWEDEGINILTLLSSCSPDLLPMSSTSQTQWKNGRKGNCRCSPYGQPPRAPGRMKDGKWIDPCLLIRELLCNLFPHCTRVVCFNHRIWQKWWHMLSEMGLWKHCSSYVSKQSLSLLDRSKFSNGMLADLKPREAI